MKSIQYTTLLTLLLSSTTSACLHWVYKKDPTTGCVNSYTEDNYQDPDHTLNTTMSMVNCMVKDSTQDIWRSPPYMFGSSLALECDGNDGFNWEYTINGNYYVWNTPDIVADGQLHDGFVYC